MFNSKALTEKWNPVLGHEGAGAIKDNYRKAVTAVLLENTEKQLREERGMINEASNTVGAIAPAGLSGDSLANTPQTGGLAGFDPVMISLIRRAMPNLVAYDICGVQPMSGPTGLIFAMKSHYQDKDAALRAGKEALYNEPDTNFSASSKGAAAYDNTPLGSDDVDPKGDGGTTDANPGLLNDGGTYERGERGIAREDAETLGSGSTLFNEMSFSIEKTSVQARTRALKAEYTLELEQDLKAIHGLDVSKNSLTSCPAKFSQKSTAKSSVAYTALLSLVLQTTLLTLVSSTSTLTAMVVGLLRNSRVFSSKSSATATQSHKRLVEERATS